MYEAPSVAAYTVRDASGAAVRRVRVGDIRGYSGGQYADGYETARRIAEGAASRTGAPHTVTFESPWSR